MGKYQRQIGEPGGELTYLDNLEADRAQIIQQLLDLQTRVNNYVVAGADSAVDPNLRFKKYAELIAKTSDPLKKAVLQKENQRIAYGHSVIRETVNLLSRIGSRLNESPESFSLAKNLAKRAQNDDEQNTTFTHAATVLNKNGFSQDKSPIASNLHPSSIFTHPKREDVFMHRQDTGWEHHSENPMHSFSSSVNHVGSHASLVNYLGKQKRP